MTRFRPLLDGEFQRIAESASSAGSDWATEWLPVLLSGKTEVSTTRDLHGIDSEWSPITANGQVIAYVEWGEEKAWQMVALCLGYGGPDKPASNVDPDFVLQRIGQEALSDFIARFTGSTNLDWKLAHAVPKSALHSGAASVLLSLKVGGNAVARMLVTREGLGKFLTGSEARTRSIHSRGLERRSAALQNSVARIAVLLAKDEFSLGDLREMRVGHVMRLNRRIDEPLDVSLPGEQSSAKCYLGKMGDHLAIRVTTEGEGKA